jgi:hypothetical protein
MGQSGLALLEEAHFVSQLQDVGTTHQLLVIAQAGHSSLVSNSQRTWQTSQAGMVQKGINWNTSNAISRSAQAILQIRIHILELFIILLSFPKNGGALCICSFAHIKLSIIIAPSCEKRNHFSQKMANLLKKKSKA